MGFYVLKKFGYYHNDDGGMVVDSHTYEVIKAFDDFDVAKQAWVGSEREVFGELSGNYYDNVSDDCLTWINQKTGLVVDDVYEFSSNYDEYDDYRAVIDGLPDDDFLTLLTKLGFHRFAIEEIDEQELHKKRYYLGRYDGYEDEYVPFRPNSRYVETAAIFYTDSPEAFFDLSKNSQLGYFIEHDELFFAMDCLSDEDLANPDIQAIFSEFNDVFKIDDDILHFTGIKEPEINAMKKLNTLMEKPFFKVVEVSYADLL